MVTRRKPKTVDDTVLEIRMRNYYRISKRAKNAMLSCAYIPTGSKTRVNPTAIEDIVTLLGIIDQLRSDRKEVA